MALKPYLQLVRLPNLFTAAADSLAGWLLATGTLAEPGRWLPLVGASVATYAGGIVLNDVFDHEIDRRERPGRPLPSGRVSRRLAAWAGGIALVLGPALAALSGSSASFVVALALAACVLGYDAGLKRTPLGPQAMGACRSLNFLLGMSQAADLGGPSGWLVAGSLGVFVAGVTWISRSEVAAGRGRGVAAGMTLQALAFVGLCEADLGAKGPGGLDPVQTYYRMVGLGGLLGVAAVIGRVNVAAWRRPSPETLQRAVKTGVFALVWIDVAAVAMTRGPVVALPVAALWVPAFLLGRWLYAT